MKKSIFEDLISIGAGIGTILFVLSLFILPWVIIAFLATGIYYLLH